LIVPDADRGLIVLLGVGNGAFQPFVEYPAPEQLFYAAIGDFNRDGAVDVATAYTDGFCIFLGNGDGTFQPANCVNISNGEDDFSDIIADDFNQDGNLDLAMSSSCCGNDEVVAILLGNGNGTFQTAQTYPSGGGSSSLATADFNGDGKIDLAMADSVGNSVSVLLGNGDGSFQKPSSFATGPGPYFLATADMNGYGKLDLVAADYGLYVTSVSVLPWETGTELFRTMQTMTVPKRATSPSVTSTMTAGWISLFPTVPPIPSPRCCRITAPSLSWLPAISASPYSCSTR
jgi:hypothetical protein